MVMKDPGGPIAFDSFEAFFKKADPRLHDALAACLKGESGRESTDDALPPGWENWERVPWIDNPIGCVYVVSRVEGRSPSQRTSWLTNGGGVPTAVGRD